MVAVRASSVRGEARRSFSRGATTPPKLPLRDLFEPSNSDSLV
jgi:hypothetical protein